MRAPKALLAVALCLTGLQFSMLRPGLASPAHDTAGAPTATSFIYPVGDGAKQPTWIPGNANGYFITQGFNTSCDPAVGQGYYLYGLYYCGHTGVDLASSDASAVVHATAAGVVISAGYNGGYGVMVRIKHLLPDGSAVYSQYEHMAYGSLAVYAGENVSQGQQLGLVGATGFATGAHLHFEIKSVDEDGWGYTFGNSSLIAGYLEPISFVAAHQARPVAYTLSSGHGVQVWPAETESILKRFLASYRHYVVVSVSDGLRVHAGPGASYRVLGVVLRGAKLGYISTRAGWIRVALPQHVTGWVKVSYVTGYQDWSAAAYRSAVPGTIWRPSGPTAIVQATGLNVRTAPGQSHEVISAVFQGDRLSVLTRTTNWARVLTRDGTRGWVLRRYLAGAGEPRLSSARSIVATAQVLNVRSGPGLQYGVTGSVFQGTRMQLVGETVHWAAVILPGGTTGWVARPMTSDHGQPANAVAARPAPAPALSAYVLVAVSVLNIHLGPAKESAVVARVLERTRLQVLARTPHWLHVALPASRIDGWVAAQYTR